MDELLKHALHEAEHGELRPQLNPSGVLSALHRGLPGGSKAVEAALLRRFLSLSRPIGDASAGPRPDLRLQDAGPFFYLLEAVRRAGHERPHELLWMLLDRFANLDERCYDELYLWCVVELSRADPAAALILWPQVLLLDLRHRPAPWQRPPGVHPVDQPYRLTELVCYYYVLYTLDRRGPSLGGCLERLKPGLAGEQLAVARLALQELAAVDKRPTFRDALGLLSEQRRQRRAAAEPQGTGGVE